MGKTIKKCGFTIDKQNALKKRTQFCLVGIFEGFIEARICLENQNGGSPGAQAEVLTSSH